MTQAFNEKPYRPNSDAQQAARGHLGASSHAAWGDVKIAKDIITPHSVLQQRLNLITRAPPVTSTDAMRHRPAVAAPRARSFKTCPTDLSPEPDALTKNRTAGQGNPKKKSLHVARAQLSPPAI
ncbi:hypothetical protein EVAR_17994_1 [Eumeta japonica]|uniref:Uncharacterized protein n=1 Tax=Eumeta variegata TaxID=151549 RepID=A0A4C1Y4P5_EUMVA|nr:hypothetical protein EVAR_17994_1 [Eumeta japonica]